MEAAYKAYEFQRLNSLGIEFYSRRVMLSPLTKREYTKNDGLVFLKQFVATRYAGFAVTPPTKGAWQFTSLTEMLPGVTANGRTVLT